MKDSIFSVSIVEDIMTVFLEPNLQKIVSGGLLRKSKIFSNLVMDIISTPLLNG